MLFFYQYRVFIRLFKRISTCDQWVLMILCLIFSFGLFLICTYSNTLLNLMWQSFTIIHDWLEKDVRVSHYIILEILECFTLKRLNTKVCCHFPCVTVLYVVITIIYSILDNKNILCICAESFQCIHLCYSSPFSLHFGCPDTTVFVNMYTFTLNKVNQPYMIQVIFTKSNQFSFC